MNVAESISLKGEINITCFNQDGSVRWEHSQPNLITNEGLEIFAAKCFDKSNPTYSALVPNDPATTTIGNPLNFHIAEIAVGTSDTPASKDQTFNERLSKHGDASETRLKPTKVITKTINNQKIENVRPENSFYFQANYANVAGDTLKDSPQGVEVDIKEVMLIAKNGDYLSPTGTDVDPRKLVARTVLTRPFKKYESDAIAVTWKLQFGT